jgi:serine/threonine protein kinase
MDLADLIGQTLDEKYLIERELGRGGMGTVYLATHLGTERPVAVKIIAPQFMKRPEFVERFRREARAAGRLRHPNVVDVTDFGFAESANGRVAYLVMEYLDGCTLGEILEEEKNLPVGWTLDILDQVCSAVHEAHEQGIIHRDLKPDNIWLEPNQRGGYTVKVLDFGIAKLESVDSGNAEAVGFIGHATSAFARHTIADGGPSETIHDSISPTLVAEAATLALPGDPAGTPASEIRTLIQPIETGGPKDENGTRLPKTGDAGGENEPALATRTRGAPDLTRVGAVLGTPLYMSPEQCRGQRLDARSDIYSLGVIAYQMLSGSTPFSGEFTEVMNAHRELPPPPLEAKKVRRKLKNVIGLALAKDPDDRPQTAEAFASLLKARSEGIWALLRRAGMIYTEHMPKFLGLSAFFFIPPILLTAAVVIISFLRASEMLPSALTTLFLGLASLALTLVTSFCAYLISGTITWIVTQSMAVPLRPIRLRPSLKEARAKWKSFAKAGFLSIVAQFGAAFLVGGVVFLLPFLAVWAISGNAGVAAIVGAVAGIIAGFGAFFYANISLMLVAPVVMMENLRARQSLRRSYQLVKRSIATSAAAFCIMFLIPAVLAFGISYVVNTSAKAYGFQHSAIKKGEEKKEGSDDKQGTADESSAADEEIESRGISFSLGRPARAEITEPASKDMRTRIKDTFLETLLQILLLPLQIVVTSFTAIIVALLYLKTRQSGGESLQDLLGKFEETEYPRKKWQERVRERLIQSGRVTSRP